MPIPRTWYPKPAPARRRLCERIKRPSSLHAARGGDTLFIDGNHDGFGVSLPHASHQGTTGKDGCATCHHMNAPGDQNTACHQCHQDMYRPTDAFQHKWHSSPSGAAVGCNECHTAGKTRTAETAKSCSECHTDLIPKGAPFEVKQYHAVGYVQAMHQLCIGCHADMAKQTGVDDFARCAMCHNSATPQPSHAKLYSRRTGRASKQTVLPPY